MAIDSPTGHRPAAGAPTSESSWTGPLGFAGVILIMLGAFHVIAGLVALFQDDYFVVAQNGLMVSVDFSTWGWTHLLLGLVAAGTGLGLPSGATWARVTAVVLAMISAIVNLAFLSASPLWSTIMIALDILIIYAATAHRDTRSALR